MNVYVLEVDLGGWGVFAVFKDKEEAEKEAVRLMEGNSGYSSYIITEAHLI